jgi:hypothetical protein
MKIFSFSRAVELALQSPNPASPCPEEVGYNSVLRLPIRDCDAVHDAGHPEREFEAHDDAFVEFELIRWKDTQGRSLPQWVLRGLVAI